MLPCEAIGFPSAGFKPKQIASGEEHNLLLEQNTNNLLVWGSNSKGQHGLGHTNEVTNINVLDFDRSNPIVEIRAKGTQSLVIVESGAVYTWPYEKANGEVIYSPVELSLPPKIQIVTASCGYNFTMLVSKSGLVFSYGKENSMGQLGHGDRIPRRSPTVIAALQNVGEKVLQISCGFRHTICKTSLGKVFTWGSGKAGQLGNESFNDELEPVCVMVGPKHARIRAVQVQAGFRHSLVMLETRKIAWTGTNGSITETNKFIEADLTQKVPEYTNSIDISPLKVFTAWSRTMSLTYVTFADIRSVDIGSQAKAKVITTLTQHLEENRAYSNIDLPYVPTIFKHFTNKVMPFEPDKKIATVRLSEKAKREKEHDEAARERAKLAGTKFEKKSQSASKQKVFEPTITMRKGAEIESGLNQTPDKMFTKGISYADIYSKGFSIQKGTMESLKHSSGKYSTNDKSLAGTLREPYEFNSLYSSGKKEGFSMRMDSSRIKFGSPVRAPNFDSLVEINASRYVSMQSKADSRDNSPNKGTEASQFSSNKKTNLELLYSSPKKSESGFSPYNSNKKSDYNSGQKLNTNNSMRSISSEKDRYFD